MRKKTHDVATESLPCKGYFLKKAYNPSVLYDAYERSDDSRVRLPKRREKAKVYTFRREIL